MAKLLRHFGLGAKKYNTNSESSEQDSRQETNVKQLDSGITGERTHLVIPERKHAKPYRYDGNGATDDLCECASSIGNVRDCTSNIFIPPVGKTSRNEEYKTKGSPEMRAENGKKLKFRRKAFRGKPIEKSAMPTTPTRDITKIVVIEDYSDPRDFRPSPLRQSSISSSVASASGLAQCPSQEQEPLQAEEEDDYIEPFDEQNFIQGKPVIYMNYKVNKQKPIRAHKAVDSLIDEPSSSSTEYDDPDEGAYDDVCEEAEERPFLNAGVLPQCPQTTDDSRPGDEYDVPWEWGCPTGSRFGQQQQLPLAGSSRTSLSSVSSAVSEPSAHLADSLDSVARWSTDGSELEAEAAMTGRQRHIYETAFDSTGSAAERDDGPLEMVNHPILTSGEMPPEGAAGSRASTPKPLARTTRAEAPVPRERRKVALVRDSLRGGCSGPALCSPSPMLKRPMEPLVTRAIVHVPPRSANSTPTLSYRAKEGLDSCASSAKSTPTHYLSRLHHLPLRQFSDLTLGENKNTSTSLLHKSTASMPPTTERRAVLVSSEESVASTSSSSSSNNNSRGSRGSIDNHQEVKMARKLLAENQKTSGTTLTKFQRHLQNLQKQQQQQSADSNGVGTDGRPAEDYDPPWEDLGQKLKSSSIICNSSSGVTIPPPAGVITRTNGTPRQSLTEFKFADQGEPADRKQSWASNEASQPNNPPNRPSFQLPLNTDFTTPCRSNLSLNLNPQSPKRKRNNLQLNFGCAALSVLAETVDPTIPLDRQGWYHGTISRIDAENLLRVLQEGCYLVRNSESSKQDYSLSLKSARGFMHMKIVYSDGVYILGQFSKPFNSIPEMIHHYSRNKLPIKGAEHMSLLHPVIDQLL